MIRDDYDEAASSFQGFDDVCVRQRKGIFMCMICIDVLKEKLTYREVGRNCRELINTAPTPKIEHYKEVDKAVSDHFTFESKSAYDSIVPKEVVRRIENT
jgi:hypothetical protein